MTIHPYPQFPSNLTNETAVEYAETYERAHAQRRELNESRNVGGELRTVRINETVALRSIAGTANGPVPDPRTHGTVVAQPSLD